MIVGPLQNEIRGSLACGRYLGANAAVGRVQLVIFKRRIIFSDRGVERVGPPGVSVVVCLLDPLRVGAEPDLARDVHS